MNLIPRRKAAKVLGVHPDTIDVWRKGNYLPAVAVPNGYRYDLNECLSLAERRKIKNYTEKRIVHEETVKKKDGIMSKPKIRYYYDDYQIKADLTGDDLLRFEQIRENLGYKYKGELLRKLILQTISLIDKNSLYIKEEAEAEELTKYYDQELDYSGVCEIMTRQYWIKSQYISKKDR